MLEAELGRSKREALRGRVPLVGVAVGVVSREAGWGFCLLFACWAGGGMGALEGVVLGVSITMVGGAIAAIVIESLS